jgi:hypothetical protein
MSEPLLRIRNHHSLNCGDPPIVDGDDPHIYIGYFENPFGEQWIFTYNRETEAAELRGGDIGWNTVIPVRNGVVQDVVLGEAEKSWLHACIAACGSGAT